MHDVFEKEHLMRDRRVLGARRASFFLDSKKAFMRTVKCRRDKGRQLQRGLAFAVPR